MNVKELIWVLIAAIFLFIAAALCSADCGVERWAVKVGTDSDALKVSPNPDPSTIGKLVSLKTPIVGRKTVPRSSQEQFEVVIPATITAYKEETDSDIHLAIKDDQGRTMIAEIPDPACMGKSPWVADVATTRSEFLNRVGKVGKSFKKVNIAVQLTGVVFFDFKHGQRGLAPNAVELHPVLNIKFL